MKKCPYRRSKRSYCVLDRAFSVLTILTILSLFLVLFPSYEWVATMASQLQRVIRSEAISTTISAIGVVGVAFGWLISRMEERIYNIRLADLVEAVYPRFFKSYVRKFILTALIGIYAGKADLFWPAFYAFLEVLVHFGFLIRVCYVFVIRSDYREQFAFSYYENEIVQANDRESVQSVLLNTADYTHMLMRKQHRYGKAKALINLWDKGLVKLIYRDGAASGQQIGELREEEVLDWHMATERYWTKQRDSVMNGIALSRYVWQTFLRGENESCARIEIIAPVLSEIRSDTRYMVRFCILIGLVQTLFGFHLGHEEGVVLEVRKLLDQDQQVISQELTLILAISLLVYRLQDRKDAENALYQLYIHMQTEVEGVILTSKQKSKTDNEMQNMLMLYTEWSARELLRIDMVSYMLRIGDELVDDEMRKKLYFTVGEKGYHAKMLIYFLDYIQYMKAIKTE